MSAQFTTTYDDTGNITVRGGWVISRGLAEIPVGQTVLGGRLASPLDGDLAALETLGVTFLGGSGRNLVVSGFPNAFGSPSIYNGVWRYVYPRKWTRGALILRHQMGGWTRILDGLTVLAELTSGGPVGTLSSTAAGETKFGAAFTAQAAEEWSAPGEIAGADMESNASGIPKMQFLHNDDTAHYTSREDPRFTIDIDEDGAAHLRFGGVEIALRDDGPSHSPEGEYESTPAGQHWNQRTPPEDEDEDVYVPPPPTNPFGILTVVYSWTGVKDLDTTTRFLEATVGYPGPYSSPYMTFSGDNTQVGGSETVVIDLAAAWAAGDITTVADITCAADWYPPESYGPASFAASYSLPLFPPIALAIQPGNVRPGSTTVVSVLRITADGITSYDEPWVATVTQRRANPPQGYVYVQEVSVAGVFSSMAGPSFTQMRQGDTATHYSIMLATSDGYGAVEAIWTGPILRR